MNVPTPEEVRLPPLPNGTSPIRWELVDPLLRWVTHRGVLTKLAHSMRISEFTLRARRHSLNLPPLPRGRPHARDLSESQMEINKLIRGGHSVTNIANARGTTTQAVTNAKRKIDSKLEYWENGRCRYCMGYGVVPPPSTDAHGAGYAKGTQRHVCDKCGGSGNATEVKP